MLIGLLNVRIQKITQKIFWSIKIPTCLENCAEKNCCLTIQKYLENRAEKWVVKHITILKLRHKIF